MTRSPAQPPAAKAQATRTVACPNCGRASVFSTANRWRPFCSERCRTTDLGAWAEERYRVAGTPPDDADDPEQSGRPGPGGGH